MRESFRQELKDLKMEIARSSDVVIENQTRRRGEGRWSRATSTWPRRSWTATTRSTGARVGVEERALEIIATQFPVARDLRLLYSLTYMTMHMERHGRPRR